MKKEYLFPTPGRVLRNLLDIASRNGEEFTEEMAAVDLMLATDGKRPKPQRYLAKRWRWSKTRVQRTTEKLLQWGSAWRSFYADLTVDQTGPKPDQKTPKKAKKMHVSDQAGPQADQYRTELDNITITKPSASPQPSAKVERETRAQGSSKNFTPPSLEQIHEYFLSRAAAKNLAFDFLDESEKFHDHFTANGWKVSGKAPMKDWKAAARNWIRRINTYGTTATNRRPAEGGPGHHVHHTQAGTGSQMPGRVHQGSPVRSSRPKRAGERSRLEALIDGGFTEVELFGTGEDDPNRRHLPPGSDGDTGRSLQGGV